MVSDLSSCDFPQKRVPRGICDRRRLRIPSAEFVSARQGPAGVVSPWFLTPDSGKG
jgi:hypothetical protein